MKSMSQVQSRTAAIFFALLLIGFSGRAFAQGTWETKASMPTARAALAGAQVNGVVYAIGGFNDSSGFTLFATVEAYDQATNTWSTKAAMPTARYVLAAAAVNGSVYTIGGYNGSGLATNEAFTPEAPNQPPIANAGADQTVDATSPAGALVILNGTGSSDPDGDSLTFSWIGPFGTAVGATPTVLLPVGMHIISLTVTDPSSATSLDTVAVTVRSPTEMTSNLTTTVTVLEFQQGVNLLNNVVNQIDAGNTASACNQLQAFTNAVQAQSGKQLTVDEANQLIASANQTKAALGCP